MKIGIAGAGLVGSVLSIFLKRRGLDVHVYEKRKDPRQQAVTEGRSINLVLAERGLTALGKIGLRAKMLEISVPLYGRMIHDKEGHTQFQPYGKEGQAIHSISRKLLNEHLLTAAESIGVKVSFENIADAGTLSYDYFFGADGFNSATRKYLKEKKVTHEEIVELEHGYKELTIPATKSDTWQMDPHALHIWPREQFMLIALPNIDGSFTCTLFLLMNGKQSFEALENFEVFQRFIKEQFPDAYPLLTQLEQDYQNNPVSRLMYMKCWPWIGDNRALIGDAAHAIVPFYGQGMNAGFEDCLVLDEMLEKFSFEKALQEYQHARKPNADAICDLSLENFIEMRDKVADERFQMGKRLTAKIAAMYPEKWIPKYSQVTFSNIPYVQAKENGEKQQKLIEKLISRTDYHENWQNDDSLRKQIVRELEKFFASES